jgi:dienelactone hydrolase
MVAPPKYFMYFPDNYRWSAAYLNMLGRGTYGGVDINDLHKIGRMLEGKIGDDGAWFEAFVKVADETRYHAEGFRSTEHPVSAAAFYLRACHYYQMGERYRTHKDQPAIDAYRQSIECFHAFVAQTDLKIDIVEVPFEGKSLPGYFVHAQNAKSERTPCVVFFDGLDITKEIQFVCGVPDLIKRGISVLLVDGPGTGEAIRFRGMPLRHDYEVAGSACIDYLETRTDVDAKKIGIVAISLGGYYSPRCASLEPRFAACIAWGAIWDYHAVWKRRIEAQFNASMSVPGDHITWILDAESVDDALRRLEQFRLNGVVQKMRCPFLVCHGEDDEQVPLEDAQALYDACGSADKTLRIFTSEEGGAQHCQRDHLTLGCAVMWNWFEDKLLRA